MPENAGYSFLHRTRLLLVFILIALPFEAALVLLIPLGLFFYAANNLYTILGILAVAAVAGQAAGLLSDYLVSLAQGRMLGELRLAMYDRLQRLSLTYCEKERGASLPHAFAEDLGPVQDALTAAVSRGALPLARAILGTAAIFWLDWRAGLAGLLFWPWILLAPAVGAALASRARPTAKNDDRDLLGIVRETLSALPAMRVYAMEQTSAAGFGKRNETVARSSVGQVFQKALAVRFADAGAFFIQLVLFAVTMALAAEDHMSVSVFAAIQILGYGIGISLGALAGYLPVLGKAREAWGRIRELLAAPLAVADSPEARVLPALRSEIGLSDLTFSYNGETNRIAGLTARIPRGSYVAFVGASGSGKSTLLKLIMRLYDPSSGRITIDGHDLRSVTQASLRGRMGIVLQEKSLFRASVRDNIRVGRPDASAEVVTTAARKVGLHDEILKLPQGYDSIVDTGAGSDTSSGVRFSAGGQQRLALARALLREPEILLLDEIGSSLDATEEFALNAILQDLRKGRTVIASTHRLSTTAGADHIFVLDKGAIIEQGNHFELLALDGMYAWLWRKQAGFSFREDGAYMDVDAERLKTFPILEDLDDAALSELAPYFATETFQPGREIVRQNDAGDKFYILARGKVEVWRTEEQSGHATEKAVLQDGDFFGEIAPLTGFPRTATVRALTVCTCLSLSRGHFVRILDRFPELKRRVAEIAVQRLRESSKSAQV